MITVAICTFNRKEYLKKAIDSILKQTLDCNLFELLIIDNNSTDGTEELIKDNYTNSNLSIKYIKEDNQGLSYCRNTAVANSKYDFVAFLDDDGIAEPQWLTLIKNTILEEGNNIGAVTGDVIPIWEIPRPDWLIPEFNIFYTIFQLSEERFVFDKSHNHTPAGANVVYNKKALLKNGGFNVKLGRNGSNLLSGEETLLHKSMIKNGYKLIYVPDIRIKHHITKARISRKWLLRRYFWGGFTNIILENIVVKQRITSKIKKVILHSYSIILNIALVPCGFIFKPSYYYMIYLSRAAKSLGSLYCLLSCK